MYHSTAYILHTTCSTEFNWLIISATVQHTFAAGSASQLLPVSFRVHSTHRCSWLEFIWSSLSTGLTTFQVSRFLQPNKCKYQCLNAASSQDIIHLPVLSPTTSSVGLVHNTMIQCYTRLPFFNECMIDFCTCILEYRINFLACSGRSGVQGFSYTHTNVLFEIPGVCFTIMHHLLYIIKCV